MSDEKNKLEASKVVENKGGKTSSIRVKNEAGSSRKTESKILTRDETRMSSDKLRKPVRNANPKISANQEVKKSLSESLVKPKEQISSPYISGKCKFILQLWVVVLAYILQYYSHHNYLPSFSFKCYLVYYQCLSMSYCKNFF